VDPFDDLTLDEDFVRGASLVEDSAEERLTRLARIEAEHRRLAEEREVQRAALDRSLRRQARRGRRSGGEGRRRLFVIGVMLVVLAGLVAWNIRNGGDQVAIGTGGFLGDASTGSVSGFARPSAGVESAAEPLGEPAPLALESSSYRFMATQEGSGEPVAYDPCRPIHVVVNGRTAFMGSQDMVEAALASVSRATGLQLVYDGITDEAPTEDREPHQPDRYGDRWAPLLISWSDPTETPELAGDAAGLGGSSYVTVDRGSVYITGSIELDGPQLAEIVLSPEGVAGARSVIEHELGHVVGLDHVEDPSQLMNPTGSGVTTFADGDLTGLSRLGRGDCFPSV
jgi:hypothetical protein